MALLLAYRISHFLKVRLLLKIRTFLTECLVILLLFIWEIIEAISSIRGGMASRNESNRLLLSAINKKIKI